MSLSVLNVALYSPGASSLAPDEALAAASEELLSEVLFDVAVVLPHPANENTVAKAMMQAAICFFIRSFLSRKKPPPQGEGLNNAWAYCDHAFVHAAKSLWPGIARIPA
jgi:hypothetical protein